MNELEDVLGSATAHFVDRYVRSLLTWDVLVFYNRNGDALLDLDGLASRLGRPVDEVGPEVEELCRDEILQFSDGLVRYLPDPAIRDMVDGFAMACRQRDRRLALIALVLRKVDAR